MDNSKCLFDTKGTLAFYNDNGLAKVRFEATDEEFLRCPSCHGTMYKEFMKDGYRLTAPCAAARTAKRMSLFNTAAIPSRFRNASFESFDLKSLGSNGTTIDQMFIKNVREYKTGQRGILLEGGPGTGKTHLLCAAVRYMTLELNVRVKYVDFSMLLSKIRANYQIQNSSLSESDFINEIVNVPVLFLDELGKGRDKTNDFEMRIIDEIINRRYNNDDLTTYFASNYKDRNTTGYKLSVENGIYDVNSTTWQNFARAKCRSNNPDVINAFTRNALAVLNMDHLEDRLEPRVVSRIFEMANPIVIEAQDHRTNTKAR